MSHISEPFAGFDGILDSDEKLVWSAKTGSESAFVELWRRHSSTVFRAVYRIVKNREGAEDHVQETFLRRSRTCMASAALRRFRHGLCESASIQRLLKSAEGDLTQKHCLMA